MTVTHTQIQRLLLIFWSIWFGIVALTNLGDALLAAGVLPAGWRFASGNYAMIQETTARHGTPSWLLPPLFAGVIAWESLSCILFARAWSSGAAFHAAARLAYTISLALWATFLIVDEFFIAFQVAAAHVRLFTAEIACLLYLALDERRT